MEKRKLRRKYRQKLVHDYEGKKEFLCGCHRLSYPWELLTLGACQLLMCRKFVAMV